MHPIPGLLRDRERSCYPFYRRPATVIGDRSACPDDPHGSHSIGRLASFARLFTSSVLLRLQLGGLLFALNYRQLPEALWTTIMPYFGAECSDGDRVAM